jgi:hypothetical protein
MKKLLFVSCIILASCTEEMDLPLGHEFELDARLPIDGNGYYHLELGYDWQTLHRITGQVSAVENEYELAKIEWTSSHYWMLGDTAGYIIHQNNTLNDDGYLYMNNDTSYVTWFDGAEVPTINGASYSTMGGEINTMFAPVQNMRSDTIIVSAKASFADGHKSNVKTLKFVIE